MELKLTRKGERYLESIDKKISEGLLDSGIELQDWKSLIILNQRLVGEKSGSERLMDIIERPYDDEEALEDSIEARQTVRRLFEAGYIEQV